MLFYFSTWSFLLLIVWFGPKNYHLLVLYFKAKSFIWLINMFLVCVFLSGSKDHSHCWWKFWGWKLWNVWSCLQSQLSLSLAKCKNISNGRAPGNMQIIFYCWFLNQSNDLNPSTKFETGSWSLSTFGERKIQATKSSGEHFSSLKRKRYA